MRTEPKSRIGFAYALLIALVVSGALSGCASTYRPVLDPHASNAGAALQDERECQQIAAGGGPGQADAGIGGMAAGGLFGAALGAALGAVLGIPGEGAAMGAAMFGATAGVQAAGAAGQTYQQIFSNCMTGRGHRVLNS